MTFTAVQLDLSPTLITSYQQRQQTVSKHQQQITANLRLRTFGETDPALEAFLFEQACHLERSAALEQRAQELLKVNRILKPGESILVRVIGEQRRLARKHIFERVASGLSFNLRRPIAVIAVLQLSLLAWIFGSGSLVATQMIVASPSSTAPALGAVALIALILGLLAMGMCYATRSKMEPAQA